MKKTDLTLTAADGHRLGAYSVEPDGVPRGGVVILQEIFGVNAHTRHDVEFFAEAGYHAIAPAMFDRIEPGAILEYSQTARGLEIANSISEPQLLADGALDKSLPPEAIQLIRAADPKGVYHVYEGADHAFTNSDRPNFSSGAAALAHARTLDFLEA